MNRDEVVTKVMAARTPEECIRAEQALRRWMQQHPDDIAMLDIGEGLAMMRDALSPRDHAPNPRQGNLLDHADSLRPAGDAEGDPYGISVEEEIRVAQTEFGWDEETARAFVASYRPLPAPARPDTPALSKHPASVPE